MGMKLTALAWLVFDDRCDDFHSGRTRKVGALLLDTIRRIARRLRDESCDKSETENEQASQNPNWWHSLHRRLLLEESEEVCSLVGGAVKATRCGRRPRRCHLRPVVGGRGAPGRPTNIGNDGTITIVFSSPTSATV